MYIKRVNGSIKEGDRLNSSLEIVLGMCGFVCW